MPFADYRLKPTSKNATRRFQPKGGDLTIGNEYWAGRSNLIYYSVVRALVDGMSEGAASILDVGSAGCPYLDWFKHIPNRTSLDLNRPYAADGVTSVKSDFLTWEPDRQYDIAICLQVMEHVPDCISFAKKLLEVAEVVVISVPYRWEKGKVKTHVQDPVDEYKTYRWFRKHPNFQRVITEIETPQARMVQVYDKIKDPWPALSRRNEILKLRKRQAERRAQRDTSAVEV
jgi:hypothetical protein